MCLPGTVEAVATDLDFEAAAEETTALSRRGLLVAGGAAAFAGALPGAAFAQRPRRRRRRRVRDLTHSFDAGSPVYAGSPPSRQTIVTVEDNGFYSQAWSFGEHSGTHVDAPGHFVSGGRKVDALRAGELFAPAAVIDISERAARDPDAMVVPDDIRRYERRHGRIPRSAIVFMYSGWERRLSNPPSFLNADSSGTYHFPGFGLDAVEVLLERRSITGIGVDTLSLDIGASATFDVHRRLLGANRYGVEAVANLRRIPASGAQVVVGVIPWQEGSGGPCRLLATY